MGETKRSKPLTDSDIDALQAIFLIHWGAMVLNPNGHRSWRGLFGKLGLVERRGKLRLTPAGRRVLKWGETP